MQEVIAPVGQAQILRDQQMAQEIQAEEVREANIGVQDESQPRNEATPMAEVRPEVGTSGAAATPTMMGVPSQQFTEMMGTMMGLLQAMQRQMEEQFPPRRAVDPMASTLPERPQVARMHGNSEVVVDEEARERERRQEARADMRAFQGLNPPPFSGDGDHSVADRWVAQMEKLFEFHQCDDSVKVRYATFMFRNQAEEWWRSIRGELPANGNELLWPEFLRIFYGQFFPSSEREKRAEEFARLVQGTMTVAEYEAKFRTLSKFASWVALDPREKGKKFQRGLKPSIRRLVALCKLEEYADIVDRARLMENEEEERSKMFEGKKRPQKGGNRGGGSGDKGQKRPRTQQYGARGGVGGQAVRCRACGQPGHTSQECSIGVVCFKCGRPGHQAKDCKGEVVCYHCGQPGHTRAQCPRRIAGEQPVRQPPQQQQQAGRGQMPVRGQRGRAPATTI